MKRIKVEVEDEVLGWHKRISPYGFIAGGSCRSIYLKEKVRDIDIFCYTSSADDFGAADGTYNYSKIWQIILANNYEEQFNNPLLGRFLAVNSISGDRWSDLIIDVLKPRMDNYMLTFGDPMSVISRFDFSVCRAALIDENTLLVDDDFEADIEAQALRIKNIVCPISTVKRVGKYALKGYTIRASQAIKLFTEWENRPPEEKTELARLLKLSEEGLEMTDEEIMTMAQMLYVD